MATKLLQAQYVGVTQTYDDQTQTVISSGTGPDFNTLASFAITNSVFQCPNWTTLDSSGNFVVQLSQIALIYDDSNETAIVSSISTITGVSYFITPISYTA